MIWIFLWQVEDIYRFESWLYSVLLGFKEASKLPISASYGMSDTSMGLSVDTSKIFCIYYIYCQVKTGASWSKSIHFNFGGLHIREL